MHHTAPWLATGPVALLVLGTMTCVAQAAAPTDGRPADGAKILSHFSEEPSDSLIQRLETTASLPADGAMLRQRPRWLPDAKLLVIESELTGPAAGRAGDVPLGEWTFRIADARDGTRYQLLTYRNDTWYGSTYWTGPDWTRVGRDWHHPGQDTPSIRRFTAPHDGKITVRGRVYKAHLDGDGVRVLIRHNERTVWQAELEGKDDKGTEPNLALDAKKGDAIRFLVHKRGQIFCDTTRWDPVVRYENGEQFVASAGFSTERQGAGGWSYEMEGSGAVKTGLPTVYAFGLDSALRAETAFAGQSLSFSDRDTLPLFVVADGADASGVVVAVAPGGAWRFGAVLGKDGGLRIQFRAADVAGGSAIAPGQAVPLPRVVFGAYRGSWVAGFVKLERFFRGGSDSAFAPVWERVVQSFRQACPLAAEREPELEYWAMIQADWRREDKIDGPASYAAATANHLERTRGLIAELRSGATAAPELDKLAASAARPALSPDKQRALYVRTRCLKRHVALGNPLLRFGPLLFVKRVPTSYSHLVMQYFGWRARPGGGLFVLERPGHSLAARDLLAGKLASGNVLEPRLSYCGKRIVFSFSKCTAEDPFYHIYEANADGTGLRQLTEGEYEDLMPNYLPDGRIVFCSTRRKGHARCFGGQFGPRWHVYTLHRMDADGSNLCTLSFHETNEWFPTVAPSGHILYSRWDYVDRHPVLHQNLWACRPDGTNPVAVWGNHTETPHCTFQLQPIPNTTKIVFTASAHHSITGGSVAIVTPERGNNGEQALTRITPAIKFPEAEGRIEEYYDAPWPLSEDYFLVGYSPTPLIFEPQPNDPAALGIYLLDRWGNRELIYRDATIGSSNPLPLVARPVPPVLPDSLPPAAPPTGELLLTDVYQGLGDIPRGSIKALRVIQILPKTTPVADGPRVGLAGQESTRAVLGTVPVEPDGSARFVVPAHKPILFQALDEEGCAYQTMRSITYLQPGETTTCIGCHERRTDAPVSKTVLALRRPPSPIEPGPDGTRPFSYVRLVQPVLDKHCVRCHGSEKVEKGVDLTGAPHEGFTRSYWALCGKSAYGAGANSAAESYVPRYGGWNSLHITVPGGTYGARGSRLMQLLRKRHGEVDLGREELGRIALWIDCNSVFYGAYDPAEQARQLRGEIISLPDVQ
jgi:hypothetical protein